MAQKVRTPYVSSFQMPDTCVACGGPAEPGLYYRFDKTQSNWSGKRYMTLNLNFPICAECHAVSRNRGGATAVGVIGTILALAACLFAGILANLTFDKNVFATIASAVVIFCLVFYLFGSLARLINEKGLSQEEKLRRRNLLKAGSVKQFKAPGVFDKTGFIDFQFESVPFATAFALLNNGKLL